MSQELVRRQSQSLVPYGEEWQAIKEVASLLRKGGFVNLKTFDTDEKVIAVILAGREMGIGPRESLDNLTPISGRISPSSALQLKGAYQRIPGFEMEVLESTTEVCRLQARRNDRRPWTVVEYTIQEAAKAGLTVKDNWKNYAKDMLMARCQGRLLQIVAPDAIGSANYSREVAQDFEQLQPAPIREKAQILLDNSVDGTYIDVTSTHTEQKETNE